MKNTTTTVNSRKKIKSKEMKAHTHEKKPHVSEARHRKMAVIEKYLKTHPLADKDFREWANENRIKYASLDADYEQFCGICALASDGTPDSDCIKNGMITYFKSLMGDDVGADGDNAETLIEKIRLNDVKEKVLEADIVNLTKKAKNANDSESEKLNRSFKYKVALLKECYAEDLELLETLGHVDELKYEIAFENKTKKGVFARIWNGVAHENDFENANGKVKKKTKVGKLLQGAGKGVGKVAKGAVRGVKRVSLAPIRGSVEALLKINAFNLAGRLGVLMQKRPKEFAKVLKVWKKFGGKEKNLQKDVTKNMNKKAMPPFGVKAKNKPTKPVAKKGFDGNEEFEIRVGNRNNQISEVVTDDLLYSNFAGGDDVAIAGIVASASTFLVALIPIFKSNKDVVGDGGATGDSSYDSNIVAQGKSDAKAKLAESGLSGAELEEAKKLIDSGKSIDEVADQFGITIPEDGFPTWAWWAIGGTLGVGVIVAIAMLAKKK